MGTVLIIIALILAVLAAIGIPGGRFALGWAAMAFYFASLLVGHFIR